MITHETERHTHSNTPGVLITGANGQLGNELRRAAVEYGRFRYVFTDVEELDITNLAAIKNCLTKNDIAYIVNCAAYTAVDKAEDDAALCYKINRDAVENLAVAAKEHAARLIHVSTDYVFDGKNYRPYIETDPVCPESIYGKSKLAGEQTVQTVLPESIIIRTAWLYSAFGNNFVKTMLRLGKERDSLNVVFDQTGTPTNAFDLAIAICEILLFSENNSFKPGIYHYSNEGVCSWYDFAKSIFRLASMNSMKVNPIEGKDYPAKAPRPHYSVLNKKKIKETFGIVIPHWESSLNETMNRLENF
ncbi:MAG: dTDP-4-dehydrorhamnose reductase [Bacteroidales bacterium]|jgi:dTDP-4-dehydrorhamnose reductase|nr:dTDP-4-dehydrorhamnose reductase [Bacteroidales bacterium]